MGKWILVALSVQLLTSQAWAWGWHQRRHCNGPIEQWTLLHESQEITGACYLSEPLKLSRARHVYPAMRNTELEVDFWQGVYSRTALEHRSYRVDVYDCRGDLQRSYQTEEDQSMILDFPIDNPNLHDDVNESFVANAPLTDSEAQTALNAAKAKCEQAN